MALAGFGVGVGAFEARLVVSARPAPRSWVRPALPGPLPCARCHSSTLAYNPVPGMAATVTRKKIRSQLRSRARPALEAKASD